MIYFSGLMVLTGPHISQGSKSLKYSTEASLGKKLVSIVKTATINFWKNLSEKRVVYIKKILKYD